MFLATIAFVACVNAAVPDVQPRAWNPEQLVAVSETTLVPESSGVVAARRSRDVYFTHGDSGSEKPRVWAFRLSQADRRKQVARHLGYVELIGAGNGDWEDIAAGPAGMIYILDGGDNPPCNRKEKRVIRFAEPRIDPDGRPVALKAKCESIRFEYPDPADASKPASRNEDRYDAECLIVHPASGDVYIVTKRDNRDRPVARVYKLQAGKVAWGSSRVHVLHFLVELPSSLNMVTAGDVDREGRHVVLRNYWSAYEYALPAGKSFDDIFRATSRVIPLFKEALHVLQGEGICYSTDGRELIITTESPRGPEDEKFRVFVVPSAAQTQPDRGPKSK